MLISVKRGSLTAVTGLNHAAISLMRTVHQVDLVPATLQMPETQAST